MIALLVVATFLAGILLDHLLHRAPILLAGESSKRIASSAPRALPRVVAGFAVPDHVRLHPGHTWALSESPDLVRVGLDDLAAKVAGSHVTKIDVPERGRWIRQGQKIVSLHAEGREISLVSPIEGTVVGINHAALADPKLAHDDPYGEGWLITVSAPDAATNFRNLLGGGLARRFMEDSAALLRGMAPAAVGAVAHDGGVALDDAVAHLSPAELSKLERQLFLVG